MSAHSDRYGTMFPDLTRLERNKPLGSSAFSALVVSHGIGVLSRTLEVKPDGWDQCVACADYRTRYDLSLAKLLVNTVLVNGCYGA
jgi:hypothetical protein